MSGKAVTYFEEYIFIKPLPALHLNMILKKIVKFVNTGLKYMQLHEMNYFQFPAVVLIPVVIY